VTQPARRFDLWRRLYSRFLIEPFPAEGGGPSIATEIVPVTDSDELLRVHGIVRADSATFDADETLATGLAVPAGRRWHLAGIGFEQTTGNRTVTRIILNDDSTGLTHNLEVFAATQQHSLILGTVFILEELDFLSITTIGGSTNTVYRTSVWVAEEDAF